MQNSLRLSTKEQGKKGQHNTSSLSHSVKKAQSSALSTISGINLAIAQYLQAKRYVGSYAMFIPECKMKRATLPYTYEELLEHLLIPNGNDYLENRLQEIRNEHHSPNISDNDYPILLSILSFLTELERDGILTNTAVEFFRHPNGLLHVYTFQ